MAKPVKYYVSPILEALSESLADVCEEQTNEDDELLQTVYTGNRPSAVENHTEFLVISISRSVYSHGPYQNAAVYVDMYVRNGQGGIEKTWRLQELCDEICGRFPFKSEENERWSVKDPKLVLSGDDQLGFTAWRLRGTLFVNTTDRYFVLPDDDTEDNS